MLLFHAIQYIPAEKEVAIGIFKKRRLVKLEICVVLIERLVWLTPPLEVKFVACPDSPPNDIVCPEVQREPVPPASMRACWTHPVEVVKYDWRLREFAPTPRL